MAKGDVIEAGGVRYVVEGVVSEARCQRLWPSLHRSVWGPQGITAMVSLRRPRGHKSYAAYVTASGMSAVEAL